MSNSVQNILVCVPTGTTTGNSTAPCVNIGNARQRPATISALVLDPATDLQNMSVMMPLDYVQSGAAFGAGVTIILTFWIIAKPIGVMIGLVNRSR